MALTFRAGSSYRHNKIPSPRVGEIALGFFGVGPLYILREIQNSDLGQTIGSENIFWVILVSELRSRALREAFRINFSSRIQPWASKNPISQGWGNSPRIFWGGPPLAALLAAGWPERAYYISPVSCLNRPHDGQWGTSGPPGSKDPIE